MRFARWLALALVLTPCPAWDTAPHQMIARAALGALPQRLLDRFGAEAGPLAEIYCMYPDRYLEMDRYGFVRKSAGPRTAAEIRAYCVRPDGQVVHGVGAGSKQDLASLAFLFERIQANLKANRPHEAAKYAGVLAHYVADSLSPPHSVSAERLSGMLPEWARDRMPIHSILESSVPSFTLPDYRPVAAGAEATLAACYSGAALNRKDLATMVDAACERDERALEMYRLRAATRAAEALADALFYAAR